LDNRQVFETILKVLEKMHRWQCFALVVMPDHLPLLVAPLRRNEPVSNFSKWLKHGIRAELNPAWNGSKAVLTIF